MGSHRRALAVAGRGIRARRRAAPWRPPALGPDSTLRVIHTPGHASNHLCYLLEEERLLFTGDHVMQGSTVVINPPDGNMAAYLQALHALLDEDLQWLAPGHGFLVAEPQAVLRALIAHRLRREAKVVAALRQAGPARLDALLPQVYDDVPAALHGVARRSLLAHLLKLLGEGAARVVAEDDVADAGDGLLVSRLSRESKPGPALSASARPPATGAAGTAPRRPSRGWRRSSSPGTRAAA
ncbi:MAG: MBL fold metallo-hydrolase [Rubrivivax sp.]|nr:MBL fold metallo-hydrolase [Rubrivivax sp.]